ncbi:MAG: hypothetical protein JNL40_16340 [Cyclobacteriaceae bacterium]|nr:hypothetical protein [Cyclobacteriaceae bacterium]
MKTRTAMRVLSMTAIMLFMFLSSCKDQDSISFSADDNSNLQSEANTDASSEDLSDLSAVAMSADAGTQTGGRTGEVAGVPKDIKSQITDTRFACATVTLEFAADNNPSNPATIHGYIHIDFGTGCTGPNGRVRKGKIHVEFIGRRFIPNSTVIITTENYSVDGIKIDGTRTELNSAESNEEAPKFTVNEDVTVTFLDGTTATRTATRVRTWNRAANPLLDTWTVTGTAFGKTRKNKEYVMTITKPLVFKRACAISSKMVIPVEGTKELVVGDKKITTDFGNGDCDTTITITINGRSKDVTISASGD